VTKRDLLKTEADAVANIQSKIAAGWNGGGWVITREDLQDCDGGEYDNETVGKVLRTFESVIGKAAKEIIVVIDRKGRFLAAQGGGKGGITLKNSVLAALKNAIGTHNHPSGMCAFTAEDVRNVAVRDAYEIRVTTQDGRYNSFKRGAGELDNEVIDSMVRQDFYSHDFWDNVERSLIEKGISKPARERIIREGERVANQWLLENANRHGYIFTQGVI
jgi:hypothetical protein